MAKKEPVRIWRATEAEQIASEEIIPRYHPDLADARVMFLFTSKERKSGGKVVWAKTSKLSGANKFLSSGNDEDHEEGYDFLVLISGEIWDSISDAKRRALVDHELSHCVGKETDDGFKWSIRTHDIEEFTDVVKRHGTWNNEVTSFIHGVAQLPLFQGVSSAPRDFKEAVGDYLKSEGIQAR